jgi:hypothetical protein
MPCLFAVFAGFAPRLAMLFLLFFTNIFQDVFDGWFVPLLGIALLPYTTLFYLFAAAPLGQTNVWGWFSVFMGLLLDVMQWYSGYQNRNNASQWSNAKMYV